MNVHETRKSRFGAKCSFLVFIFNGTLQCRFVCLSNLNCLLDSVLEKQLNKLGTCLNSSFSHPLTSLITMHACKHFHNRGDCLIWDSWCSIKIPLWWLVSKQHQRYLAETMMWCQGIREDYNNSAGKVLKYHISCMRCRSAVEENFARFLRWWISRGAATWNCPTLRSETFHLGHISLSSSLFSASYMAKVYSSSHKAFHGSYRKTLTFFATRSQHFTQIFMLENVTTAYHTMVEPSPT